MYVRLLKQRLYMILLRNRISSGAIKSKTSKQRDENRGVII